jgi:hypothetical protein
MTMHLLPAYYNNNSTKKKKPFRKPGWAKAQAEHDKWLLARGVHPSQLKNKSKNSGIKAPNYKELSRSLPTSDKVGKIVGKSKSNAYTGTFITGIATMHKSNMVPVNKNADAKEYSTMRRN